MSEQKDTIYIDVDDDITSIIDKVAASSSKIVALVLPKRSTVMQSVVNMRLLKRTTEDAGKSLVLITSESSVLPLAGAVGLYTAATLQSKPFVPESSGAKAAGAASVVAAAAIAGEPEIDPSKPIGVLAGDADEDTIQLDNETADTAVDAKTKTGKTKKPKKDKKLKIPNFDTFRKKLFLGIGIFVLLGILWYVAFYVMPSAKIYITTDTTTAAVNVSFVADPNAKEVDVDNKVVPAKSVEVKKNESQKSATTGEKNLGEKAKGNVTMTTSTNCVTPVSNIPAGTTVSSGNLSFVTQGVAVLAPSGLEGGKCIFESGDVAVIAANAGDQYNLSGRAYTVAGYGSVVANGSNMSGGTNKIVKIVSQADIDTAKQKVPPQNFDAIKAELGEQLSKDGYKPVTETFTSSEPVVTNTPNVGDEANEVTVNVATTHTMQGVQEEGLKKIIEEEAKKQDNFGEQAITDAGMDEAIFQVFNTLPSGATNMNVKTDVTAGPQLDANAIKVQVAGKRRGEIQSMLNQPGTKDVEVAYSPFWVTKTPKNQNKITIIFKANE